MTRRFVSILACLAVAFVLGACDVIAPPVPPPAAGGPPLVCQGVPAQICQQGLDDARNNADPGIPVVQVRIVCTSPPCTVQNGATQVDVLYANGRRDSFGSAWESAGEAAPAPAPDSPEPVPSLPVEPTCQGILERRCHDLARDAIIDLVDSTVVAAIAIRCEPGPCDPDNGAGTTTVTFQDGTITTWEFNYGSAQPS